jgi:hypothetical protein
MLPALTSRLGCRLHHAAYHGQPPLMLRLANIGTERLAELVTGAWRTRPRRAGH